MKRKLTKEEKADAAFSRVLARLADETPIRYSWNRDYWENVLDWLEEAAEAVREKLSEPAITSISVYGDEPPVEPVPEPVEIPTFVRTKEAPL